MNLFSSIIGKRAGKDGPDGSLIQKLNYIFDRKQKRQFLLLGVMILIGGLFETLGVSMLLPVVQMIRCRKKLPASRSSGPFWTVWG